MGKRWGLGCGEVLCGCMYWCMMSLCGVCYFVVPIYEWFGWGVSWLSVLHIGGLGCVEG